ncbi:MAG: amino acid adenylation domain-containing protein [Chloroflexota bacterium]
MTMIVNSVDQIKAKVEFVQPDKTSDATLAKPLLFPKVFAEQAAQTPDGLALAFHEERLTYAELDRCSNQFAHYLRRHGVGPEVIVALAMERPPSMIIALLGVLKAGGAYIPLDPSYPSARLSSILTDAQPALLVTEGQVAKHLSTSIPTICIDAMWEQIEKESTRLPPLAVSPENTAYIMYASSSTGQPKGVVISHGGLANLVLVTHQMLGLDVEDRVLQFAPLDCDTSIFEMVAAFSAGAQLRLATQDDLIPSPALVQRLHTWEITCTLLPPSALATMPYIDLPHLHTLLSGDEDCSNEIVTTWGQGRRFINIYGLTETGGVAMFRLCQPHCRAPSLGTPAVDSQMYLLDGRMQPVPEGVSGEVYVGGSGVGQGYLNQPVLTAERFVPNPFANQSGTRLYRTGDLARYQSNGELEFLGRTDHQVHIQGHRIELEDIEANLLQHPDVGDCVVVAQPDNNQTELLAYVVPADQPLQLPNQMYVFGFDPTDTFMIFQNIFVDENYYGALQPLPTNACVFDVGANIGIFTLQMHHCCPDARVYAFEPIPANFDKLRRNVELYGLPTRMCNYGLSNVQQEAVFTFYPNTSFMSTQYANVEEVHKIMSLYIDEIGISDFAKEQMEWKYTTAETVTCNLHRISDVMREENLEQIDLLKIVVERAELDVLNGIDDADWPKIKQIVVELRDEDNRLSDVCTLLERQGYHLTPTSNDVYDRLYYIFAVHSSYQEPTSTPSSVELTPQSELLSHKVLHQHLQERLPSYMVPSEFIVLDSLPTM